MQFFGIEEVVFGFSSYEDMVLNMIDFYNFFFYQSVINFYLVGLFYGRCEVGN